MAGCSCCAPAQTKPAEKTKKAQTEEAPDKDEVIGCC